MKKLPIIILIVFAVTTLGIIFFVDTYSENQQTQATPPTASNRQSAVVSVSPEESEDKETLTAEELTQQQLLYLIEEEKLAHDVYTVFYKEYGARIFGNILESESTHQEKVLTLLEARDIPDPRSSDVGVFTDSDLQNFYNELIAQGMENEKEAIKAGIIIEETDIADLQEQLSTTTDADVTSALEDLLKGSENHLRAFNRQI